MSEFAVPSSTRPRDVYRAVTDRRDHPNGWPQTHVTVKQNASVDAPEVVMEYDYRYSGAPFEPFRQLRDGTWHDYALAAVDDYTRTCVLDLEKGEVVAREPWPRAERTVMKSDGSGPVMTEGDEMPGWGFCPVEFYVPDWWDVHDGSVLPGHKYWDEDCESPTGEFGFVSGCVWGDDTSWKLRYVDLSRVSEGQVTVDERFGYLELARNVPLRQAVDVSFGDIDYVEFAVAQRYSLSTGKNLNPGA